MATTIEQQMPTQIMNPPAIHSNRKSCGCDINERKKYWYDWLQLMVTRAQSRQRFYALWSLNEMRYIGCSLCAFFEYKWIVRDCCMQLTPRRGPLLYRRNVLPIGELDLWFSFIGPIDTCKSIILLTFFFGAAIQHLNGSHVNCQYQLQVESVEVLYLFQWCRWLVSNWFCVSLLINNNNKMITVHISVYRWINLFLSFHLRRLKICYKWLSLAHVHSHVSNRYKREREI